MKSDRPNVLMIVLDSARPDWFSCYNPRTGVTPHIDRLAEQSLVFEKAISPSAWTFPVMASVFTGMLPTKHGGHDEHRTLDSEYPTLAESLVAAGYDTAAIADVPYVGPMTNLDRGFRYMSNLRAHQVSLGSRVLKGISRVHRSATGKYQKTFESRVVIREGMRWIEQGRDASKPFFLYIHSDETHAPFLPPARFRNRLAGLSAAEMHAINQDKQAFVSGQRPMSNDELEDLRNLARAETAYADEWVGYLLDRFEKKGLLKNTTVVIAADHGENFGEHGLLRHGLCLYDTLLHVPLIIRLPNAGQCGHVKEMVQLIDLVPTLLKLAGCENESTLKQLQGRDLVEQVQSKQFASCAVSELYRPATGLWENKVPDFMPEFRKRFDRVLRSVRTNTHKFIWSSNGKHELYDLLHDPDEGRNVVETEPALALQLRGELDLWLESFRHYGQVAEPEPVVEDDERVVERLRDLGYVE